MSTSLKISVCAVALCLLSTVAQGAVTNAGPAAAPSAWWDERASGYIGAGMGIYGGIFGSVVGTLASRPRAHRLVAGLMLLTGTAGVASAAAGLFALTVQQPYAVWYPLLLGGGVFAVISFGLLPVLRHRLMDEEMRRIDSQWTGDRPRKSQAGSK